MFTASFGPGGFRTTRVHMGGRRPATAGAAPAQGGDTSIRAVLAQLAPILILFFFTIMSALPNLFGPAATPDPRFSFSPTVRYNTLRTTNNLRIPYHVNSKEFNEHPIGVDIVRTEQAKTYSSLLRTFERTVEQTYVNQLAGRCQRGQEDKQRRKEQKSGIFGIGADWEAVKKIDAEKVESCEELKKLGVL